MKKMSFSLALVWLVLVGLYGQSSPGGEWAAGLRFGGGSGATVKKYNAANSAAWELLTGFNFDSKVSDFYTTVTRQKLAPLAFNDRLCAQFGLGATAAFGDVVRLGPAATLGFDWRLAKLPIGIQLDWTPTWFIFNESHFSPIDAGFSIRYIF
jgi:hypothetical protein